MHIYNAVCVQPYIPQGWCGVLGWGQMGGDGEKYCGGEVGKGASFWVWGEDGD